MLNEYDAYNLLVTRIVKQAVIDWRLAKKNIKKFPRNTEHKGMIEECEKFFLSEYFYFLTGLDGVVFLKKLKSESK